MKTFTIASVLYLSAICVICTPQYSQCGRDGCLSVDQNGQGVGCGPSGCGLIGSPTFNQPTLSQSPISTTRTQPGVACGQQGCGVVRNDGYGIGCGPNGCGPLGPPSSIQQFLGRSYVPR